MDVVEPIHLNACSLIGQWENSGLYHCLGPLSLQVVVWGSTDLLCHVVLHLYGVVAI